MPYSLPSRTTLYHVADDVLEVGALAKIQSPADCYPMFTEDYQTWGLPRKLIEEIAA